MLYMLDQLLVKDTAIRFMDSPMLHVCKTRVCLKNSVEANDPSDLSNNWDFTRIERYMEPDELAKLREDLGTLKARRQASAHDAFTNREPIGVADVRTEPDS